MYGLEAIDQSNGWAISVVGITIVFSGLVSLSIVISQLHKILDLWENPSKIKKLFARKSTEGQDDQILEIPFGMELGASQKEIFKQFALLARTLEDHFSLSRLLQLAKISGVKDPYDNLNLLLKIKVIKADGDGYFTWSKPIFEQVLEQ